MPAFFVSVKHKKNEDLYDYEKIAFLFIFII